MSNLKQQGIAVVPYRNDCGDVFPSTNSAVITCECYGGKYGAEYHGRTLVPLICGEQPANWRRDFRIEHQMMEPNIRKSEDVHTERYNFIRYFDALPVLEEPYYLLEDPLRTINLINSPKLRFVLEWSSVNEVNGGGFTSSLVDFETAVPKGRRERNITKHGQKL